MVGRAPVRRHGRDGRADRGPPAGRAASAADPRRGGRRGRRPGRGGERPRRGGAGGRAGGPLPHRARPPSRRRRDRPGVAAPHALAGRRPRACAGRRRRRAHARADGRLPRGGGGLLPAPADRGPSAVRGGVRHRPHGGGGARRGAAHGAGGAVGRLDRRTVGLRAVPAGDAVHHVVAVGPGGARHGGRRGRAHGPRRPGGAGASDRGRRSRRAGQHRAAVPLTARGTAERRRAPDVCVHLPPDLLLRPAGADRGQITIW